MSTKKPNKKRITIQLMKNEEWVLERAHLLAERHSLSLRQLILETLVDRLEKEKSDIDALVRLKGKPEKVRKK